MIELLVLGVLAFAGLVILGVLSAVASLLFGLVLLPFKLLGLMFKGVGFLFALPFLALGGFVLLLVVGVGLVAFLLPLLPVVLLIAALVWLFRRGRSTAVA